MKKLSGLAIYKAKCLPKLEKYGFLLLIIVLINKISDKKDILPLINSIYSYGE
jgi:hypothetical protein